MPWKIFQVQDRHHATNYPEQATVLEPFHVSRLRDNELDERRRALQSGADLITGKEKTPGNLADVS